MRMIYGCKECGNVYTTRKILERMNPKFDALLPVPRCPCGCMDDYSLCKGDHQQVREDIRQALKEAEEE